MTFCPVALYADDHTIGRHEVLDRCAFLEKFGVRSHFEIDLLAAFGQLFLDDGLDFFAVPTGTVDLVTRIVYF